jgi:hypothetical protein
VSPYIPLTIGRAATLRNHGAGLPLPNAGYEFDQAINHQADPDDDQQAPIEPKGSMLRREGQVWQKHEEIEQTAEDHGSGLFEKAGEHVQWPVASGQFISYPLPHLLLDEQQIPRCGRCGDLALDDKAVDGGS